MEVEKHTSEVTAIIIKNSGYEARSANENGI